MDPGAHVARALCHRLGQVGGLDIAVLRVLDRADQALGVHIRPFCRDLAGLHPGHVDPDRLCDAHIVFVLVGAVGLARQAHIRDDAEADILAGLLLKRLVEAHRVFVNLAHRVAHVEERQEPRRMPGGARGQLLALQEDAIRPAFFRQMIKGRDADDAAAHNHNPRMRLHWLASSQRRLEDARIFQL